MGGLHSEERSKTATPLPAAGSVEQIAAHIGISRTGVFGLIKTGRLPCVRIGNRTLVRYADADELLAKCLSKRAPA